MLEALAFYIKGCGHVFREAAIFNVRGHGHFYLCLQFSVPAASNLPF
jgi:hypothetical protein